MKAFSQAQPGGHLTLSTRALHVRMRHGYIGDVPLGPFGRGDEFY
jgi:hypothetical protein